MAAAESINHATAESFQDYVRDFSDQIIGRTFYEGPDLEQATPHEGIKGEEVLSELIVGDLAVRYGKTFESRADQLEFKPKVLKVEKNKVELMITPKDFETSYLGAFRKKGQDDEFIPFEGFIMNRVFSKLRNEIQHAFWRGEAAAAPAATDLLRETSDGILTHAAALQAAGHTVVPVPGGVYTEDNILSQLHDMYTTADAAYQYGLGFNFNMSPANALLAASAYALKYQREPVINPIDHSFSLEFGRGRVVPRPHMAGSNRVLLTDMENLHYGYDDLLDTANFGFQKDIRSIKFWLDFNFGTQIGLTDDDIFVMNDLP